LLARREAMERARSLEAAIEEPVEGTGVVPVLLPRQEQAARAFGWKIEEADK